MKAAEAMETLGLVGTALAELTAEQVRGAYRATVKALHPDVSKRALIPDMDKVGAARDELLRQVAAGGDFACRQCSGNGTVPARLGVRPCGACRGTGERNGS